MAASLARRILGGTGQVVSCLSQTYAPKTSRNFASISRLQGIPPVSGASTQPAKIESLPTSSLSKLASSLWPLTSIRTAVRYSKRKGLPKTVKAIPARFFRLNWGIYIRPRAGRDKKKWKKPDWIIERGKYHVFCNKTQSKMFDKMTTAYWKKRRHYVNDPYERYQRRFGMDEPSAPKFLP